MEHRDEGEWVRYGLSKKNKEDRISVATSILSRLKSDSFPKNIIEDD